jgi:predicted small lipoprotein YifL
MIRRKTILAALVLLLLATVTACAQKPLPPASQQPRPRADRMRGIRGERRMKKERLRLAQRLQLSDVQEQQRKAILQRRLLATKAQREQLFQLREKRLSGALTAEDRQSKAATPEITTSNGCSQRESECSHLGTEDSTYNARTGAQTTTRRNAETAPGTPGNPTYQLESIRLRENGGV